MVRLRALILGQAGDISRVDWGHPGAYHTNSMLQRAYDLICFDVDGTLVRHPTGKVIWEVLNERYIGDHSVNVERHRWFNEGRISYEQWVELDVQGWITAGATRGEIVEMVREFEHFDGAHETLQELKRRGARLAIIS